MVRRQKPKKIQHAVSPGVNLTEYKKIIQMRE
jgi:hypothetical protein